LEHGVERKQRYAQGKKNGWYCPECSKETSRAYKVTAEQRLRYNAAKRSKRSKLSSEDRRRLSRQHWLRYTYGLSLEEYDELLSKQGGVCAICGESPNGRPLDVDHCHKTEAVRGLLCNNCNLGIGKLADDVGRIRAALSYLEANAHGT
jgi:hypothetical protein